jgi:hypothetical protein
LTPVVVIVNIEIRNCLSKCERELMNIIEYKTIFVYVNTLYFIAAGIYFHWTSLWTHKLNCQRVLLMKQNKNNYTDQLWFSKLNVRKFICPTTVYSQPNPGNALASENKFRQQWNTKYLHKQKLYFLWILSWIDVINCISNFRDYCYVIIMYSSVFNQVRRHKVLYFSSYTFLCIDTSWQISWSFYLFKKNIGSCILMITIPFVTIPHPPYVVDWK